MYACKRATPNSSTLKAKQATNDASPIPHPKMPAADPTPAKAKKAAKTR